VLSRDDFASMASWFGDVLTGEDLAVYKDAWRQPRAVTGMRNWYRAADAGPPDPERGRPEGNFSCGVPPESLAVPVETLVVWGNESLAPLSLVDGLAAYVSKLSVVTVPGAGHWLPEGQPAELNRRIREFLSS